MYAIYIITNTLNGMQYVGITNDIARRWKRHKNANENQYLHKAIKKYGSECFVFTHFADAFDVLAAKAIERMLISEHNTLVPNGYNLTLGGDGTFGRKHTEEEKKKIRDTNKLTWSNPELRKTNGQKVSLINTGKPNGRKGKTTSKKGVPHSESHRENLAKVLKSPEFIKKSVESRKKTYATPEWKANQSAKIKASWAIRKAKKLSESGVPA